MIEGFGTSAPPTIQSWQTCRFLFSRVSQTSTERKTSEGLHGRWIVDVVVVAIRRSPRSPDLAFRPSLPNSATATSSTCTCTPTLNVTRSPRCGHNPHASRRVNESVSAPGAGAEMLQHSARSHGSANSRHHRLLTSERCLPNTFDYT